jgi:hypothetical protein
MSFFFLIWQQYVASFKLHFSNSLTPIGSPGTQFNSNTCLAVLAADVTS